MEPIAVLAGQLGSAGYIYVHRPGLADVVAARTATAAATTSAGRRLATTHRPVSAAPAAPRRC